MAKIFGYEVDLKNALKIVPVVAAVFSLNNYQQKQIESYVKMHNMEWVEKRRRDAEIEQMIREEVRKIT